MEEKKFIAFDLGAESGRCMVGVLANEKLSLHEIHRFETPNIKLNNGFHWDILAIYKEILEGLKKAKKYFSNDFVSIGIDTWGVDYVLLDPDDRILGYPYHYRDVRTDNMMEEAFKIVTKEEIYQNAGIQFLQINTLYQLLSEKKRKLNLLNVADKILFVPDFLNFLLSGKKLSEYSIASTSSLVDPFQRNWSWKLIDAFGLPKKIFPEIVEPGTVLGNILPSVAQATDLSKDISIIATTCHDTASAVVSVPALDNDWAYLSSGTWSLMGIEVHNPITTQEALINNFTNEGGFENTIRFLKNIIGLWPIQECRRYWTEKLNSNFNYSELISMARENGPANSWVDLNDPRFLKAGEMPEKVIAYLNETEQEIKTDFGFIIRVIIESLAFSYRDTFRKIESITGKKLKRLHIVGGGIQNELLTQLTADALNCEVVAGPVEGAVIGNIGVQAISKGIIKNLSEWRKLVANSFELKVYKPQHTDYFDENEHKYNNILKHKN
ncbi:rhamnulokinase [Rosettibacter firmus]|uniref:rhamnulokinase n=1 Tax=Rosettibacter firmus TaxID=3111522 RepID=UPI00336BF528